MKRRVAFPAFLGLAIAALVPVVLVKASGGGAPAAKASPVLVNACLITQDVNRLAAFYAQVLEIEPHKAGDDYVEFRTSRGVLAIFSADAQEKYIPGSARPGENHSLVLEFEVDDVDREYARLHDVVKTWVKKPSTQPWGTRSIYFRDPDGNLVDLFTVVKSPQVSR